MIKKNYYYADSCHISYLRLANEKEIAKFNNQMESIGYKRNAEKKKIEEIKWRAEEGDAYYYIGYDLSVVRSFEYDEIGDNGCYNAGNYFQSKEEAQKYADKFKAILKTM